MKVVLDPCFLDLRRQQALGATVLLLAQDPTWRGDMRVLVREELIPACRHGKLGFFQGADGQPIGWVVWAHLSDMTEARMFRDLDLSLHLSEWNEGPRLWLRALHLPRKYWAEGLAAWQDNWVGKCSFRFAIARKGDTQLVEMDARTAHRVARYLSR